MHVFLLLLYLASTSCGRSSGRGPHANITPPAAPSSNDTSWAAYPASTSATPTSRDSSRPLTLPPGTADCIGLERPPTTEPRDSPRHGKYEVRARYIWVLSSDALVADEINGWIAADLASKQSRFVKYADQAITESKGDPEPLTPNQLGQQINCDLAGTTKTMVSIECAMTTFVGGAHPGEDHLTYNFGICARKGVVALTLRGLCRLHAPPCEEAALGILNRELMARGVDVKLDEHADALQHFAITQVGLRFFANDDLPHVLRSAGTIDIPFARLHDVLRNDGPLAGLVAP